VSQVLACESLATLDTWFDRATSATRAVDVFHGG
jgi:hypothetical protein